MFRILRAFAWMRWRVVVNSLERSGARDTLQRFSLALEHIGPLLAAALFIPSAVSLAAIAAYAGYVLATSPKDTVLVFEGLRYILLTATALSIIGPIVLPAGERTNAVRLLLLPIPRPVLYVAQTASALIDPWNLLVVPIVLFLPVGLAAGGATAAALVALLAGMLLLSVLLGLSSLATLVLHLVMRDRRRGELMALAFVVLFPVAMLLPGLMDAGDRDDPRSASARTQRAPEWVWDAGSRIFALAPSEVFYDAMAGATGRSATVVLPLAGLLLMGSTLHGLGLAASSRMLESPASNGGRRAAARRSQWTAAIPGLPRGASAVALNQLRLAIRTPRGRSTLISPLLLFAVFAALMWRTGGSAELAFIELQSGVALAAFGSAACLLTVLPFAMNQFAIDGSGLTMEFLSPLSDLDILLGKAVGNGLIVLLPAFTCVLLARLLFPDGTSALWLSVPLIVTATYTLAAPAAAATSAIFPRAVDLNSIGSRSNAHGLAGLLGMLAFAGAAAPPMFLLFMATRVLDRPSLAPAALLIWCILAALICRALLAPVSRLLHARRENLALIV